MCLWEAYNNPTDFFVDVINGDSTAVASVADMADQYGGKQPTLPLHRRDVIAFLERMLWEVEEYQGIIKVYLLNVINGDSTAVAFVADVADKLPSLPPSTQEVVISF